ncbi:MAG: hypothetical protein Q9219_006109 [cf. Caloplaca sp. 3 TL-2023]
MDSSMAFPHDNKAHDRSLRDKDQVIYSSSQSTPFLQTDDVSHTSRHASITGSDNFKKAGNALQIHGWPNTAIFLKKKTAWTYLSLLWAVIVTFLPVIFLVLGFAVLSLDGNKRSDFGDGIIELSKYGATMFPFVFAAIAGRLLKAVALWRSEKGARLGLLEQLVGSQSLGATVERFVLLGRFDVMGAVVVVLWVLSPLGSQMSLRLLGLTSVDITSQTPIQYFNTTTPAGSNDINSGPTWDVAFGGLSTLQYDRPSLTAFMGANMLASADVLKSPVDQWNNIKIPRLDAMAYLADESENPWVPITNSSSMTWASLSGLMMQGLNASGNSTFIVQTSYIDVICSDVVRTSGSADDDTTFVDMLKSIRLTVHINDESSLFSSGTEDGDSGSLFLDTNSEAFTRFDAPQNLFYASRVALVTGSSMSTGVEVYNCSYTTPKIEGNVTCVGQDCAITQVRRWEDAPSSPLQPPFNWVQFASLLQFIPGSLGYPHSSTASPVDQYMLGSDAPFSLGFQNYAPDFSKISGADFGKRLTTLINTAWHANLAPFSIALGSSANFSSAEKATPGWFPTATATATNVHRVERAKYAANRTHAIILIVITVVLQIFAIVGLVLKEMTMAPDILGYVSTMTRDNVHTAVPSGGNTLDGVERARYLSDMRVQLVDARPGDDVGHVVLRSIENGNESELSRLDKRRLYL